MTRLHWADTAGMPLRTRAFAYAMGAAGARQAPLDQLTPEQIDARRALAPPPRFPATLVTGRVHPARSAQVRVPVRDGSAIPARVHLPMGEPTGHVVLFLHGGGWAQGRPIDYESVCTQIAAQTGAAVLVPDYRLAPQAKAPVAVHDSIDVLDWIRTEPPQLGGPVRTIAVCGDSAGGNLAALVTIDARDRDLPLAGQVLVYPATDLAREHPYRNAPVLPGDAIDAYKRLYLEGSGVDAADPVISPLRAQSLHGCAPALVQTAELDPLRDEGELYADRLRREGVAVRSTRWRGVPHGYLNFPGATHVGYQARAEIIDQLNAWWR